MAVIKLYNLARMTTATTGTGTITLGSAATVNSVLYLSFASAGVADGEVVMYGIADTNNSEVGYGTYTSAGTTLTRNVLRSTNSNNAISLSGSAQVFILGLAENAILGSVLPQGRVTLSTGAPVMTSTVSAATTVYYTPYNGNIVPIYNGAFFVNTPFTELSQATTDTTKSPAAVGTFGSATNVPALYDMFVWNDSGTIRCTRGPGWSYGTSGSAIISTATPAVVTWTAHGLTEGTPVVVTGTTLPTGITTNTVYYVGRSPSANSFNLATSVANAAAGTFVGTGGSSSGTQTVTSYVTSRGTGAGTTEIARTNGLWTNANDITNGPAATKGTYVGTVLSNTSSQIDFIFGAASTGGTAGVIGVFNAYNRARVSMFVRDSGSNHTYSSSTVRSYNDATTMRVTMARGLNEDSVDASWSVCMLLSATTASSIIRIGVNATTAGATLSLASQIYGNGSCTFNSNVTPTYSGLPGLGWNYVQGLEQGDGTNACTFYGGSFNGLSVATLY